MGINFIETLPKMASAEIAQEVKYRVRFLKCGGYILSSAHHIQSDAPLENVVAMYNPYLRYAEG